MQFPTAGAETMTTSQPPSQRSNPARALRGKMADGLVRIMASHSPLSARLAEEAGFDGLWASGFELSALYGLADVSLISMTQHLDMVRAIVAQSRLPLVADLDTGFGNAVNVIYAVEQYERAGAAAVVIEDKSFPKVTSLAADARQELLRIAEFQGKIEAAVAARRDPDFLIVARTEALIAGLGEAETLKRAAAYAEAGADMILVHSKQKTPDEIERFVTAWTGALPIAIVPTAYPQLNEARIRALGKIGMVIYGNHAIRAAVTAMQNVFARVIADGGIHGVDQELVPVDEIFRLQRMDQIKAAERKFLR
jgi:phosphoenolpyruvate phosphomutase